MEEQSQQCLRQESPRIRVGDMTVAASSRLRAERVIRVKRLLKLLPMLMAGLYLLNTVLSFFDMDYSIISYLAGVGVIPLVFIFLASYAFNFCAYHRMFLWYIVANDLVCWVDYNFELPISNWSYLVLHFIVAGVFLFLVLWLKIKRVKSL